VRRAGIVLGGVGARDCEEQGGCENIYVYTITKNMGSGFLSCLIIVSDVFQYGIWVCGIVSFFIKNMT
jgi:hypothetical protein